MPRPRPPPASRINNAQTLPSRWRFLLIKVALGAIASMGIISMPPPGKKSLWEDKLLRSAFFFGALLFHLLIFLIVATWVVFKAPPLQPNGPHRFNPPVVENPPAPPPSSPAAPAVDLSVNIPAPDIPRVLSHSHDSDFKLAETSIDVPGSNTGGRKAPSIKVPAAKAGDNPDRIKIIHNTVVGHWHRTQQEINNHEPSGTFPVYVAAYADGDWACNTRLDQKGNIVAGSIPDLVAKINEWGRGRIKGEMVPKPLDIGGPELLAQMPPFIFFTGHKDFFLTKQEVTNLQNYLENGGAIWGDNALAGQGSRFDIAFHREMKRVVPDWNKNFEPLSMGDDIFMKSWFPISQVPEGMNYHSEPLEHLDIGGKLAILYTPNDYSDLYAMRILPGDTQMQGTLPDLTSKSPLMTSGLFLSNRDVFFRNFTLQSSLAVHRLGMNIVSYLLTRFDDELLLNP